MDGDKTEGAVESKSLSRRPMDIWISVFGTEQLQELDGYNQSIYGRVLPVADNPYTVEGAAAIYKYIGSTVNIWSDGP